MADFFNTRSDNPPSTPDDFLEMLRTFAKMNGIENLNDYFEFTDIDNGTDDVLVNSYEFSRYVYDKTAENKQFWKEMKLFTFGNQNFVRLARKECTTTGPLAVQQVYQPYHHMIYEVENAKNSGSKQFQDKMARNENECLDFCVYGEVGEAHAAEIYSSIANYNRVACKTIGKISLLELPWMSITPDFIIYERDTYENRDAGKPKDFVFMVKNAVGVGECKTTIRLVPDVPVKELYEDNERIVKIVEQFNSGQTNALMLKPKGKKGDRYYTLTSCNFVTVTDVEELLRDQRNSFKCTVVDCERNQAREVRTYHDNKKIPIVNLFGTDKGRQIFCELLALCSAQRWEKDTVKLELFFMYEREITKAATNEPILMINMSYEFTTKTLKNMYDKLLKSVMDRFSFIDMSCYIDFC